MASLLSVFVLAHCASLHANGEEVLVYPIAPVPLLELLHTADLVAVVDVESINGKKERGGPWGPSDAQVDLRVLEVLRGDPEGDRISVLASFNIICPQSPDYQPGESRLVFLEKRRGRWTTIGLHYGTKSVEHLPLYRKAIQDWGALREGSGPRQRDEVLLREFYWLGGLLHVPELRQEAVHVFLPEADDCRLPEEWQFFRDSLRGLHPQVLVDLFGPAHASVLGGRRCGELWGLWALVDPLAALDWLIVQVEALPEGLGRDELGELRRFRYSIDRLELSPRNRMAVESSWEELASSFRPYEGKPSTKRIAWARSAAVAQLHAIRDGVFAFQRSQRAR